MKAFKLININDTGSSFLEGSVPDLTHISASHFFSQSHIEMYELTAHPAPRYQFVITLKGKLKFTVTDGRSFILEPGILLIADDLKGKGHTWEILEGSEWQRVYIVLPEHAEDHFVPL
jgi:hypothetical protein